MWSPGGASPSSSKYPPLLTLEEGEEISDDLRQHLRRIRVGHNLTSVLHSPAHSSSSSTTTNDYNYNYNYNVDLLQSFTLRLFDSLADAKADAPKVIPSVIPAVQLQDFARYRHSSAAQVDRFLYQHHERAQDNRNGDARGKTLAEKHERAREILRAETGEDDDARLVSLCLSAVPARFFSQEFSLDISAQVDSQTASFQLQQRLSSWLDLVEVCLWKQTTSQAQSFFNALSDLRSLVAQVQDACAVIAVLRRHIRSIKTQMAARQLTVMRMKRRKENAQALITLAALAKQVRATLPTVDSLLAVSHDYGGALALIREAKKVLAEELGGVKSLRTLNRQLSDYEDMIADRLTANFIDLCVTWEVAEDGMQARSADTFEGQGESVNGGIGGAAAERGRDAAREKLLSTFHPLVNGLLRIQKEQMHAVLEQYRKRVVEEVQSCAKDSVIEALSAMQAEVTSDVDPDAVETKPQQDVDDEEEETLPALTSAQQLTGLRAPEFISFLKLVFYNLEMVMNRAHQVHLNLCVVLETVTKGSEGQLDESRVEKLRVESQEIVGVVCDLAQQSVKQLLTARAENHAKYLMEEVKELWDVALEFCLVGEGMGKKKWFDLRGTLLIQAKKFLEVLHEKQTNSLYAVLDGEEWKQADVPFEIQAIVNRMVKGKLGTPLVFSSTGSPSASPSTSKSSSGTQLRRSKSSKSAAKDLFVLGKPYRVVSSVLMLITYLERCLSCAHNFANLSSSVLARVVEMLRLFNERTNSLVLQAEACKTAGLKRINTKNLALACQSLTVIVQLIPSVMKVLKSSLAPKLHVHLTNEMDRVVSELETHQKRIYEKFVDMIDHLMHHCCEVLMREVQWDARTADGLGKPQDYMTKLTHGVTSMHNVLCKLLSEEQVREIFTPIFDLFNTKIPQAFANVDPSTPTGRSRVRVDIKHLLSTLRRLRGLSGPGDFLDEFLAEKFGSSSQAAGAASAGPVTSVETTQDAANTEEQEAEDSTLQPSEVAEEETEEEREEPAAQEESSEQAEESASVPQEG